MRPIAFYLPQFHPTLENDKWWGKGFTEWTNVSKMKPLFRGHYQPHLPADLGHYDLRVPETRHAQAEMAREYGVEGFCYYHYWMGGHRLLERPFNEVLASGEPDLPFCLCWANESWSRRWMGDETNLLIKQTFTEEDDRNHARWLCNVFADPRCIRVKDRPLFLIWRPSIIPHPRRTTDILRDEAVKAGLPEPWLVGVDGHSPWVDFRTLGFDATIQFQAQFGIYPKSGKDGPKLRNLVRNLKRGIFSSRLKIYDDLASRMLMEERRYNYPTYPCTYVAWDHSPRRGEDSIIFVNSSPETFRWGLTRAAEKSTELPEEEQFVFINAWNEWAEGNHLEPDQKYGHAFLEVVRDVVASSSKVTSRDASVTALRRSA